MPYSTVSFRMTLSDLEWLSKMFNDTKRRAVSLRQQSFLLLCDCGLCHRKMSDCLSICQAPVFYQNGYQHLALSPKWYETQPYILACPSGTIGSVAVRAAWLRWSASLGSRPGLAGSCQVIVAYALRLNSRAGTEGSTVSSFICDRWLILGLETLSISRR